MSSHDIPYPQFAWPKLWLPTVSVILGIILLLAPHVTKEDFSYRIVIAVVLIVVPVLTSVALWIARIALTFYRRGKAFERLLRQIVDLEEKLQSALLAVEWFIQENQKRNTYIISYCFIYENRPFIALRKKQGPGLTEGQRIMVINRNPISVIGYFRVAGSDDGHYLCEKDEYMDALWLGYVKQAGTVRSEAPPEAFAMAVSETTGDNDV